MLEQVVFVQVVILLTEYVILRALPPQTISMIAVSYKKLKHKYLLYFHLYLALLCIIGEEGINFLTFLSHLGVI